MRRRAAVPALFFLAALTLAACGSYDQGEAEGSIVDKLDAQVEQVTGSGIASASCPDDVDLEAGTTFDCTATLDDGKELLVNAEIIDDDGNAEFNISPEELSTAIDGG